MRKRDRNTTYFHLNATITKRKNLTYITTEQDHIDYWSLKKFVLILDINFKLYTHPLVPSFLTNFHPKFFSQHTKWTWSFKCHTLRTRNLSSLAQHHIQRALGLMKFLHFFLKLIENYKRHILSHISRFSFTRDICWNNSTQQLYFSFLKFWTLTKYNAIDQSFYVMLVIRL